MANETSKTPTKAQPQSIPLSKIHDLPGVFNPKPQDKSLGSMVLSIESSGVKEAVILRQRDDGEYQLLSGYRRCRASELAKKQDIPAFVYEMTMQEAIAYRKAVRQTPNAPIPGKLVVPSEEKGKSEQPAAPEQDKTAKAAPPAAGEGEKDKKGEAPAAPGNKGKQTEAPAVPGDKDKPDQPAAPEQDKTAKAAPPTAGEGEKDKKGEAAAAPGNKDKPDQPAAPEQGKPAGAAPPAAGEGEKDKQGEAPDAPGDKDKPDQPAAPEQGKPAGAAPPTAGEGEKDKKGEAPATPGDKDKPDQPAASEQDKTAKAAPSAAGEGEKGKKGEAPDAPGDKDKPDQPAAPEQGKPAGAAPPAAGEGEKDKKGEAPAAPGDKAKSDQPAADKHTPTVAELEARAKAGEKISLTELAAASHAEREAEKGRAAQPEAPKADQPAPDKGGEALTAAIEGPSGTAITQIFEKRLAPPDEASRKTLPVPQEGESYFITLHPAYLEKSVFNNFSVDTESENFKELLKSIELGGIKDPVLARFSAEGKLEIISGQRRHIAATMLNYSVPTIIQKIGDADAKIMVADGNLHRDKISYYDLSRALRMKMEGMKQKAGRRKKGYSANELQSDAKLAQEMGMPISKLNRIIRMSEAVKGVCDLVDADKLSISVAAEMSALKPKTQENVLHLMELGYKATNERISRVKKAEAGGQKLDDMELRKILDDKDIQPKQPEPVQQPEPPAAPTPGPAPETTDVPVPQPPIPASPDVPAAPEAPQQGQSTGDTPPWETAPAPEHGATQPTPGAVPPTPRASEVPKEDDPFKGGQERPEVTKVILTGDRLRKYFPDVSMTPREIEESVYSALEERRQRQMKEQQKAAIFKRGGGPTR